VTGGAGFIGSQYVRMAITDTFPSLEDTEISVIDKLTYAGNLASLDAVSDSGRLTFIRGDICDEKLVESVLPGHEVVINFAAETHVDRSISSARAFIETNVKGVQTLLDACLEAGTQRFIQISTDEVYGSVTEGSWTEGDILTPNSPYAASKAAADLLALSYVRTHGLDVRITRCCNNYGPFQYPEKIIPLFITNLLSRRKVPLYGSGLNVRNWVHVDDHCRGIQLVLERGVAGGIYHIQGDTELTNEQLTRAVLRCCGADWDMVENVSDRKGHDHRYSLDDSKLRALGYIPMVTFERGLTATVEWYEENRSWWEPLQEARSHKENVMI